MIIDQDPLRMLIGGEVIPLYRQIDWGPDIESVTGLDLFLEQIAPQIRVPALRVQISILIDHTMMSSPKYSDRIDIGLF